MVVQIVPMDLTKEVVVSASFSSLYALDVKTWISWIDFGFTLKFWRTQRTHDLISRDKCKIKTLKECGRILKWKCKIIFDNVRWVRPCQRVKSPCYVLIFRRWSTMRTERVSMRKQTLRLEDLALWFWRWLSWRIWWEILCYKSSRIVLHIFTYDLLMGFALYHV